MSGRLIVNQIEGKSGASNIVTVPSGHRVVGVDTGSIRAPGSVLQVVQAVKTNTFSTTTNDSWIDVTGWSASITPYSINNKIFIMANGTGSHSGTNDFSYVKLLRDSTDIFLGDSRGSATRASADLSQQTSGTANVLGKQVMITYLDSPNTTSSITYKMQVRLTNGTGILIGGTWDTADDNRSNVPTVITLMEIAG